MDKNAGQKNALTDDRQIELVSTSVKFLLDLDWWRATLRCAYRFAPRCLGGALTLTVANIVMLWGNFDLQNRLSSMKAVTESSIGDLLGLMLTGLAVAIVGLMTSLWAFSIWLFLVTAFSRAYKLHGPECTNLEFDLASKEILARKGFLSKFWLLYSAYLLVPVIPFALLVVLKIATRPEWTVNGQMLIPLPTWMTVQVVDVWATLIGSMLFLITFACSCVGICFSALASVQPFRTATNAIQQCFRHSLVVLSVSICVGAVNLFLTAPMGLIAMFIAPSVLERELWFGIVSQIWLGATSTIVWTASVAPFCMITAITSNGQYNEDY